MGSLPPSPAPPSWAAPAYNSPILARARLCGRRGAPALSDRGLRGLQRPWLSPSLPGTVCCSNKGDPPPRPSPHQGPSAGDGHCVSPEAREGMRGGETPWPGGDLNTGLGEVWGSENKGGQRDVSDGETARRRGGRRADAEAARPRAQEGAAVGPPKACRNWTLPSAIPGAHVCRTTPVVPVHLGAP